MEPEISPLAKRLAEENNVNWRGLDGSGADGRILERDVLEYLARVMAGDEALDPTPEPVPEGMEAWPEEDTQGYIAETSAPSPEWSDDAATQTQNADVELDDMMFDAPETVNPNAVDNAPVEMSASRSGDTDIADDMFLFGEDEPATPSVPTMNVDADALMNADAATDAQEPDVTDIQGNDMDSSSADMFNLDADTSNLDHDLSADAVNLGADDLDADLDDLDDLEFDEDVASLFVDDVTDGDAEADVMTDADAGAPNFSLDSDFDIDTIGSAETDTDLIDHVVPPVDTPPATSDTPDAANIASMGAAAAAAGAFGAHAATSEADEVVSAERAGIVTPHDDEHVTPAEHIAEVITHPQVEAQTPEVQTPETQTPEPQTAEPVASAQPGATQPAFVSYGTLLRRHVDTSALLQAQTDIAKELGHNESAVLSTLVLRACAKAQESAPLGREGQFGVADLSGGGISLAAVSGVASQGFDELLSEVQNADASAADELALVIVDMSTSGVDEAVLNIDVPVLTIGRTLFDSTEGTHRSTISLSGDIPVEAGSKFIAAVADLLDTPIRLVL